MGRRTAGLALALLLAFSPTVANAGVPDRAKQPQRRAVEVAPQAPAAMPCLAKGDDTTINALLSDGGPGTRISLCPGSTFRLSGPVVFTAKDQELSTEGYPTDETRATLLTVGKAITAVQGDCRRCARVALRNVQIDGQRPRLGRATPDDKGGPLVAIGNNEGQVVEHCVLTDPRGWAAVHVREGDNLNCAGARIEHNEIGPVGEEWIEEVDGSDPEASPLGKPLGDGVSLSCRDSSVSHNTFVDTTDAAVVIYGSPGSTVSHNKVTARSMSQMGGILMVDYGPFGGSYLGTKVAHNTIDALGGLIRVAIGVGPPVWSDDFETVLTDGDVRDNIMRGYWMGYGIAAAGVKGFTIVDNVSTARHSGTLGDRCPLEPVENSPPAPFLFSAASVQGEFQKEFVDGAIQYVVCIDPESDAEDLLRKPKRPPMPEVLVEDEDDFLPRDKTVMDEIFDHSRQRFMEALDDVQKDIDNIALVKEAWEKAMAGKSSREMDAGMILSSLSGLSTRVANLESERRHLRITVDALRDELITLTANIDTFENRETDILDEVLTIVSNSPRLPAPPAAGDERGGRPASSLPTRAGALATRMKGHGRRSSWLSLGVLALLQAGLIGLYVWTMRKHRGRGKDLKTN